MEESLRVLMICQLPKEIGGNYTTGAANVVYELSKKRVKGITLFTYGTNIPEAQAIKHSSYPHQYLGYRMLWFNLLISWLLHPIDTFRQWNHYSNIDHNSPLRFAFYKENIERAIKLVKPDLIHVHNINNLSSTYYALKCKRVPILLTCHGIFYRGEENDIVGRDMYLGNVGFANAYSGLTEESLDEFERLLGIPREQVAVIPNGVDCEKFYYDAKARKDLRRKLGINDNVKVLITVASVQERKGQFAFVKLLKQLDFDYQYWIIGGGADVPLIKNYIEANQLESKVKLLGYHKADELYAYYSAADIYAHVSTMEGQALCEIEANATGLRTIVDSRITGTVPDLSQGDYYILDQERINVSELEAWMEEDTSSRSSRTKLDWQIIMEKYAELYNRILSDYNS